MINLPHLLDCIIHIQYLHRLHNRLLQASEADKLSILRPIQVLHHFLPQPALQHFTNLPPSHSQLLLERETEGTMTPRHTADGEGPSVVAASARPPIKCHIEVLVREAVSAVPQFLAMAAEAARQAR